MINIISIHHESLNFKALQRKYIERYTNRDFRLCAAYFENKSVDIDGKKFEFQSDQHVDRLNFLFNIVKDDIKNKDELLVFMDSDAFPVANWVGEIETNLKNFPIVAIERRENPEPLLNDSLKPYPHASFFCTTVGFWQDNGLKWELDPPVIQCAGVTFKRWMDRTGHKSYPLLRSNVFNIHPLYFGVYGNLIYHHGAGNRLKCDSADIWSRPKIKDLQNEYKNVLDFNQKLSDLVYEEIVNDNNFIKNFFMGLPN